MAVAVAPQAEPFEVHLDVFAGPFDVLLGLIAKHKLDVTEVALAAVTSEFVSFVRASGGYDLDQMTGFLVIAATLLDLKTVRLLPSATVDDEEDLALLEARDLLFARLLQYRAFKQVAAWIGVAMAAEALWTPRAVGLPTELAELLPAVVVGVGPTRLAELAAQAQAPRPPQLVDTDHVHIPRVSIREHISVLTERLLALGTASFRALCADCEETIEVVARFLGILELYRDGAVSFTQLTALGDLQVHWVAAPEDGLAAAPFATTRRSTRVATGGTGL